MTTRDSLKDRSIYRQELTVIYNKLEMIQFHLLKYAEMRWFKTRYSFCSSYIYC